MLPSLLPDRPPRRISLPDELLGVKPNAPPGSVEGDTVLKTDGRRGYTPLVELIQKPAHNHEVVAPSTLRKPSKDSDSRRSSKDSTSSSSSTWRGRTKESLNSGMRSPLHERRHHSIESRAPFQERAEPMLLFSRKRRKSTGENDKAVSHPVSPVPPVNVRPPQEPKVWSLPSLPDKYSLGFSLASPSPRPAPSPASDSKALSKVDIDLSSPLNHHSKALSRDIGSDSDFGEISSADEGNDDSISKSMPDLPTVQWESKAYASSHPSTAPCLQDNEAHEVKNQEAKVPTCSTIDTTFLEQCPSQCSDASRLSEDQSLIQGKKQCGDVSKLPEDQEDHFQVTKMNAKLVASKYQSGSGREIQKLATSHLDSENQVTTNIRETLEAALNPYSLNKSATVYFQDVLESKGDSPVVSPAASFVTFSAFEQLVLRQYFEMHDDDNSGTLDRKELMEVIDDIGRKPPKGSEDAESLEQQWLACDCNGDGELDFSEFLNLFASYYGCVYERVFKQLDEDQSGSISQQELLQLFRLLRSVGMDIPAEQAVDLAEAADHNGDGSLDFSEFCNLMQQYRMIEFGHLRKTAGFPEDKIKWFQDLFSEYDVDHSGSLEIKEAARLFDMGLLGRPLSDTNRFVELFARMDADRSASLDFEEFLRLLRVWTKECDRVEDKLAESVENMNITSSRRPSKEAASRRSSKEAGSSKEVATTSRRPSKNDESEQDTCRMQRRKLTGRVSTKTAMYFACAEPREETLEKADKVADASFLHDIEDGLLARQWGLSIGEVNALRECFILSDMDGSGTIDRIELTILLRNVGLPPGTKAQKMALADITAEETCTEGLDFRDIVILVSKYHEALRKLALNFAFRSEDRRSGVRFIPVDEISLATYGIGQFWTKAEIEMLMRGLGVHLSATMIDESTFLKMLKMHRTVKIQEWRKSCGFNKEQVEYFHKACFPSGNVNDTVRVELAQVREILDGIGYAPTNDHQTEGLMSALTRIDQQDSGSVSFEEFLLMLRYLENDQLSVMRQAELQTAKRLGLNSETMRAVRRLFSEMAHILELHGPRIEVVSVRDTKILICRNLGMCQSQDQRKQLNQAIEDVSESDGSSLNFVQFLLVLERLEKAS